MCNFKNNNNNNIIDYKLKDYKIIIQYIFLLNF